MTLIESCVKNVRILIDLSVRCINEHKQRNTTWSHLGGDIGVILGVILWVILEVIVEVAEVSTPLKSQTQHVVQTI